MFIVIVCMALWLLITYFISFTFAYLLIFSLSSLVCYFAFFDQYRVPYIVE